MRTRDIETPEKDGTSDIKIKSIAKNSLNEHRLIQNDKIEINEGTWKALSDLGNSFLNKLKKGSNSETAIAKVHLHKCVAYKDSTTPAEFITLSQSLEEFAQGKIALTQVKVKNFCNPNIKYSIECFAHPNPKNKDGKEAWQNQVNSKIENKWSFIEAWRETYSALWKEAYTRYEETWKVNNNRINNLIDEDAKKFQERIQKRNIEEKLKAEAIPDEEEKLEVLKKLSEEEYSFQDCRDHVVKENVDLYLLAMCLSIKLNEKDKKKSVKVEELSDSESKLSSEEGEKLKKEKLLKENVAKFINDKEPIDDKELFYIIFHNEKPLNKSYKDIVDTSSKAVQERIKFISYKLNREYKEAAENIAQKDSALNEKKFTASLEKKIQQNGNTEEVVQTIEENAEQTKNVQSNQKANNDFYQYSPSFLSSATVTKNAKGKKGSNSGSDASSDEDLKADQKTVDDHASEVKSSEPWTIEQGAQLPASKTPPSSQNSPAGSPKKGSMLAQHMKLFTPVTFAGEVVQKLMVDGIDTQITGGVLAAFYTNLPNIK